MHSEHNETEASVEHTHEYTHTHPHEHTHDHHDHTQGDTHAHTHSYTHSHTGGAAPHAHADACQAGACNNCPGCGEHTPMEELLALMQYMVGHNAAHAQELAGLAKQLEEAGQRTAYDQVMLAVSDFEKGNLRLRTVLQSLQQTDKE